MLSGLLENFRSTHNQQAQPFSPDCTVCDESTYAILSTIFISSDKVQSFRSLGPRTVSVLSSYYSKAALAISQLAHTCLFVI